VIAGSSTAGLVVGQIVLVAIWAGVIYVVGGRLILRNYRQRRLRKASASPSSIILPPERRVRADTRVGLPVATVIVSAFNSVCNACGGGCDPFEKTHTTRLGYGKRRGRRRGCGIEFTHISTPSSLPQSLSAARRMRRDLVYIDFPQNAD
jgi:hypothetical protein